MDKNKESDIPSGVLRQRRNLLIVCIIIFFYYFAGITVPVNNTLMFAKINIQNGYAVPAALWFLLIYFWLRYYQYFHSKISKRSNEYFRNTENHLLENLNTENDIGTGWGEIMIRGIKPFLKVKIKLLYRLITEESYVFDYYLPLFVPFIVLVYSLLVYFFCLCQINALLVLILMIMLSLISCAFSIILEGLDQTETKSGDVFTPTVTYIVCRIRYWWQYPAWSFVLGFLIVPAILQTVISVWKLIYWSGSE